MRQLWQNYKTGELAVVEVPSPRAPAGGVLVETSVSLISSGTERTLIGLGRKSLLAKARARPDLVAKVIAKAKREGSVAALEAVRSKLDSPIPLGYSLAGRVLEVGRNVTSFARGDRVACAGAGYANHAEANAVPINLAVPIPTNVTDEDAAFVTVGAIALQGVRLVRPALGETVAVIGLGLIGQLTVSLLAAHGCDVIAVDVDPTKVALALTRGAVRSLNSTTDDVVEAVRSATQGFGVDAVIITASSDTNAPLVLAGDIARDRARISIVGMLPIDIPRKSYYEKELEVVVSRSYGPGRYDTDYEERGIDYPIGFVRWSLRRNLEAVIRAIASKRLNVSNLVTHRFSFDRVDDAYALITSFPPTPHLGVLLTYPSSTSQPSVAAAPSVRTRSRDSTVRIGVLGTGSFATSTLLPVIRDLPHCQLVAVASGRGLSARHAARKFGALEVVSGIEEMLNRLSLDAVVVSTRHDSHAQLASTALRAGTHVFVEKPLAITEAQLAALDTAVRQAGNCLIMAGFNRRFAPFALEAREALAGRTSPLIINARINAGAIPRGSWVTNRAEGGGRIIGECCHFIDLFSFWTDSQPVTISTHAVGSTSPYPRDENVCITITFADGSIGSLTYTSMADPSIGKERYEVISEGTVINIEDWRALTITKGGRSRKRFSLRADKGHARELESFFAAVRMQATSPISWDSLHTVTLATFAAELSLAGSCTVHL